VNPEAHWLVGSNPCKGAVQQHVRASMQPLPALDPFPCTTGQARAHTPTHSTLEQNKMLMYKSQGTSNLTLFPGTCQLMPCSAPAMSQALSTHTHTHYS